MTTFRYLTKSPFKNPIDFRTTEPEVLKCHQVVPNLYEVLFSAEHKRRYFEECPNSCGWTLLP